ncbi:MAG TPA: hypothetical protein VH092_15710 [Urbifossiella sp.]|jgi:hypothetical protein|nr:hypothetical protein [Urbifossiella sp.]
MIRKLVLSAVLATGTLTGLASTADAQPPAVFHRRFEVFVQYGHRWEPRGRYFNRFEAEQAARHLRHEGFRVEIREF